jgi:hypothetical protein
MKANEPLAHKIKKYTGPNPFTYSQARDYPLLKIGSEFFPTSKYWNRFNVSNEILIGSRGSGKTILLRMMTYTSLINMPKKQYENSVKKIVGYSETTYIGFYVPLRLRVLDEIGKTDDPQEERRRFSFLFNCACAGAVINEILTMLSHVVSDDIERLLKEREVIDKLKSAWCIYPNAPAATLQSLQEQIDRFFDSVRMTWAFDGDRHPFDSALLEPIISVIPILENIFGFDKNNTTWMACFDEAEYLNKNLQRVLNTVMRSESRGLAVKIATLPFHYKEFQTEVDGEYVQPEGDDFRFETIDYSYEDNDFKELTDGLIFSRLSSTHLFDEIPEVNVLDAFVGESSHKDLISVYRSIFSISDDLIDEMVCEELSRSRNNSKDHYSKGEVKRYKPLYLLRELYKKTKDGNTKVPRLSGADMIRRVSDGNVRRFIQICDKLFEYSRAQHLRANSQHDAVMEFSKQRYARSESVYREGFLLYKLLDAISDYLHYKFYDDKISDVGIEFTMSEKLLANDKVKVALEMGVAYSYFSCPNLDIFYGLTNKTKFKLTNSIAAYKWLPMRAGNGVAISEKSDCMFFLSDSDLNKPVIVNNISNNLELDF